MAKRAKKQTYHVYVVDRRQNPQRVLGAKGPFNSAKAAETAGQKLADAHYRGETKLDVAIGPTDPGTIQAIPTNQVAWARQQADRVDLSNAPPGRQKIMRKAALAAARRSVMSEILGRPLAVEAAVTHNDIVINKPVDDWRLTETEILKNPCGCRKNPKKKKAPRGRKVATIGAVIVYRSSEGEYIVARPGAPERQWYYTDNKEDAVATAETMQRRTNGRRASGQQSLFSGRRSGRRKNPGCVDASGKFTPTKSCLGQGPELPKRKTFKTSKGEKVVYTLVSTHNSAAKAKEEALRLRAQGYKARAVASLNEGVGVYRRGRKKVAKKKTPAKAKRAPVAASPPRRRRGW